MLLKRLNETILLIIRLNLNFRKQILTKKSFKLFFCNDWRFLGELSIFIPCWVWKNFIKKGLLSWCEKLLTKSKPKLITKRKYLFLRPFKTEVRRHLVFAGQILKIFSRAAVTVLVKKTWPFRINIQLTILIALFFRLILDPKILGVR